MFDPFPISPLLIQVHCKEQLEFRGAVLTQNSKTESQLTIIKHLFCCAHICNLSQQKDTKHNQWRGKAQGMKSRAHQGTSFYKSTLGVTQEGLTKQILTRSIPETSPDNTCAMPPPRKASQRSYPLFTYVGTFCQSTPRFQAGTTNYTVYTNDAGRVNHSAQFWKWGKPS